MYVTEYVNDLSPSSSFEILNSLLAASRVSEHVVTDLLIVHDTDPDGITAAAILTLLLKRNTNAVAITYIDIAGVSHGKPAQTFSEAQDYVVNSAETDYVYMTRNTALPPLALMRQYDAVFILDHSYCREVAEAVSGNEKTRVVYIDHHGISDEDKEHVKQHPLQYYFGPSYNVAPRDSTTGIMVELLNAHYHGLNQEFPDAAKCLLKVANFVDIYDAWKFKDKDYALVRESILDFAEGCFTDIEKLCLLVERLSSFASAGIKIPSWCNAEGLISKIEELGKTSRYIKEKVIKKIVSSGPCILEHPEVKIGLVYHSDSYGEIAEKLFEQEYDVALIATIKNGKVRYSARSRESSPVTARGIALLNGGGGHEHSAGFIKEVGELIITKGA